MCGRRASVTLTSFCETPKEHDSYESHTIYVSQTKEARAATEDHAQDGYTDVENALAALNEDDSTDLEETDVQKILLAYKESRQLRGEQRVNRGGKPHRIEDRLHIKELISRARCRICREKGHWARDCPNKGKHVTRGGEEAKPSLLVYFGRDHCTPCYIEQVMVDTGCSRLLDWTENSGQMGTDAHGKVGFAHTED